MNGKRFLNTWATFFVLIAIYSAPVAAAKIPQAKSDNLPSAKPGKGLVIFYRPSKAVGGGMRFEIIDSAKGSIGQLLNGKVISSDLKPGSHTFTTRAPSVDGMDSITVSAEAGKTYYVRGDLIVGWPSYRPKFVRMSEAEARSELASMK